MSESKGRRVCWVVGHAFFALYAGCAPLAQGASLESGAACHARGEVVDQVDGALALLIANDTEALRWAPRGALTEGMVLVNGRPSRSCLRQELLRTKRLRARVLRRIDAP